MKNKLKIMILHNIVTPYRLPLFEELSKKYDLTVYFCRETDNEREWSTKLKGYSFKYKILPSKNIGPFVINPTLRGELEENEFDLYLLDENPENAFSIKKVIQFAKKRDKKRVLWNERIDNEIYSILKLKNSFLNCIYSIVREIYRKYREGLYKESNSFITFSNRSKNFLVFNQTPNNRIFFTEQIMPESLLPKPTWKDRPTEFKNKKIIFYLGYLNERKGVNYLIEAFNKLNRKDTFLLIAGTGNQEGRLRRLAKNNPSIKFLGYLDGINKANYYSISDFFVFPTLYDVWGLVINEAFYYGLPIISTDKAVGAELIDGGKTGFIIKDKDSNILAESIKKLLDNPKLLTRMKKNVKLIPKSKIVDIKTTANLFEKAIEFTLFDHETPNKTQK